MQTTPVPFAAALVERPCGPRAARTWPTRPESTRLSTRDLPPFHRRCRGATPRRSTARRSEQRNDPALAAPASPTPPSPLTPATGRPAGPNRDRPRRRPAHLVDHEGLRWPLRPISRCASRPRQGSPRQPPARRRDRYPPDEGWRRRRPTWGSANWPTAAGRTRGFPPDAPLASGRDSARLCAGELFGRRARVRRSVGIGSGGPPKLVPCVAFLAPFLRDRSSPSSLGRQRADEPRTAARGRPPWRQDWGSSRSSSPPAGAPVPQRPGPAPVARHALPPARPLRRAPRPRAPHPPR